jgi:hypothetical protein
MLYQNLVCVYYTVYEDLLKSVPYYMRCKILTHSYQSPGRSTISLVHIEYHFLGLFLKNLAYPHFPSIFEAHLTSLVI